MPNVTTEQRLIKPVINANPVPGHDLVVFRRVGGGHRFHSIVEAGRALTVVEKMLLGANVVAYAVTRDQNLRYKFTVESLKSADHVGPFSLTFTLAFRITDPRLVVEKLDSDPLRRLEQEVGEVLGRESSRLTWAEVEAPESEFEGRILGSTVLDEAGRRVTSLGFLQGFAAELGFQLKSIQVSRQFAEEVGEAARVAWRERQQRVIVEEQKKTALVTRQLDGRIEEVEAWQKNAVGNIERMGAISTSAAANLSKVLEQISDKVDSAPALREVLAELVAMRDEIAELSSVGGGGGGNGEGREVKRLNGATTAAALLPAAARDPLAGLLLQVFGQLGELPCAPSDRRRLFSHILHLVGEVVLLEEADSRVVEDCALRLQVDVRKLVKTVESSQRELLLQLQDPEWVRAELAQG